MLDTQPRLLAAYQLRFTLLTGLIGFPGSLVLLQTRGGQRLVTAQQTYPVNTVLHSLVLPHATRFATRGFGRITYWLPPTQPSNADCGTVRADAVFCCTRFCGWLVYC